LGDPPEEKRQLDLHDLRKPLNSTAAIRNSRLMARSSIAFLLNPAGT
jgi:hypothetical protein